MHGYKLSFDKEHFQNISAVLIFFLHISSYLGNQYPLKMALDIPLNQVLRTFSSDK